MTSSSMLRICVLGTLQVLALGSSQKIQAAENAGIRGPSDEQKKAMAAALAGDHDQAPPDSDSTKQPPNSEGLAAAANSDWAKEDLLLSSFAKDFAKFYSCQSTASDWYIKRAFEQLKNTISKTPDIRNISRDPASFQKMIESNFKEGTLNESTKKYLEKISSYTIRMAKGLAIAKSKPQLGLKWEDPLGGARGLLVSAQLPDESAEWNKTGPGSLFSLPPIDTRKALCRDDRKVSAVDRDLANRVRPENLAYQIQETAADDTQHTESPAAPAEPSPEQSSDTPEPVVDPSPEGVPTPAPAAQNEFAKIPDETSGTYIDRILKDHPKALAAMKTSHSKTHNDLAQLQLKLDGSKTPQERSQIKSEITQLARRNQALFDMFIKGELITGINDPRVILAARLFSSDPDLQKRVYHASYELYCGPNRFSKSMVSAGPSRRETLRAYQSGSNTRANCEFLKQKAGI